MADGITLSTNIGTGAVIKTDDDGTFHWQVVKMAFGADNTQTEVTSSVGLPTVLLAGTAEFGKLAAGVAEIGNVKNSGTFAVQIDKFTANAAITDNFANPTTSTVSAFNMLWDGATWDRAPGNAADGILVNLGANNDITGTVTANAGTNLNTSALALETGGNLATLAGAVSGSEFQVDVVASLPTGTNSIGQVTANAGSGTFTVDNAGTFAVQATLAAETTKVIGTINVSAAQTIAVTNAGTFATQATLQANSGVDIGDVDVTSISAGANLIGDVGMSGARTSGGTTLYKNIDVDESEDQVKATAGQVYWIQAINLAATPVFLKIYNATAASVTVGTTVPDLTFAIPSQGDSNGAGFVLSIPNGIELTTAITIAATTGVADNNAGAPAANTCIVNLGYA